MESKALALGMQVKAEALNSNVHLLLLFLKQLLFWNHTTSLYCLRFRLNQRRLTHSD